VSSACRHVAGHFDVTYEAPRRPIAAAGQPCCTWGPAIGRGSMYHASCDFICTIPPAMFAETALPVIEYETRRLRRSIFHLDGPGALVDLDALPEIPTLEAIQWTCGVRQGRASDWIDACRCIQVADKGVGVNAADISDAPTVLEHLRPEGVWFNVGGSCSRAEAEAFVRDLERRPAGGR